MTAGLFTAASPDGRSRRRIVVDLVTRRTYGDVIDYPALAEALGVDLEDRDVIYRAVGAAQRTLRANHQRSLAVVPKVGYRVLQPAEHEQQARQYERQSRKRLAVGLSVMRGTDLSALSDAERQRHLAYGMVLQAQADAIAALQHRTTRLEQLVGELARQVDPEQRQAS